MICTDCFFEIQKDFFFWYKRHIIQREDDSLGETTANWHIKTQASGFGRKCERFLEETFNTRKKKDKRTKKKKKRGNKEAKRDRGFIGVISSGQRKWKSSLGDLWKRTHIAWRQTIFLDGNFSKYGQMKFVSSHLYMIQLHVDSGVILLICEYSRLIVSPIEWI